MSMQKRTWSISGLSVELDTDRRTLAKRLQDLPPAETRKIGGRTESRWLLCDVLDHIQDSPKGRRRGGRPIVDAEMIKRFNQSITHELFPVVLAYFQPLMLTGCVDDCGLTEQQSKKVYGFSAIALSFAVQHALNGDEHMTFNYPDKTIELLKQVGDESRAGTTKRN